MRLEVENLHFSYPGKDVLRGVDFDLSGTEIMCVGWSQRKRKINSCKVHRGADASREGADPV